MGIEPTALPLSALLSQVLIAFTMEFDRQMDAGNPEHAGERAPSLALWANVLRFIGENGIDQRRLPPLSGVSKPAVHSMVACLERHGWIVVEPNPSNKQARMLYLTRRGRKLSTVWESTLADVEKAWQDRLGKDAVHQLREALEAITERLDLDLPHYPMAMSHRGGTPAGH